MAISGFPIVNQAAQVAANVRDLSRLPTIDKTNIVNAIIELENTKADQDDMGDVDNLDVLTVYATSKT